MTTYYGTQHIMDELDPYDDSSSLIGTLGSLPRRNMLSSDEELIYRIKYGKAPDLVVKKEFVTNTNTGVTNQSYYVTNDSYK